MSVKKQKKETSQNKSPRSTYIIRHRRLALILIDAACFCFSFLFFKCITHMNWNTAPTPQVWMSILKSWPSGLLLLACAILGLICGKVYRYIWRYPNVSAYGHMILSDVISCAVAYLLSKLVLGRWVEGGAIRLWETIAIFALFALVTLLSRFVYQLYCRASGSQHGRVSLKKSPSPSGYIHIGIVGAGQFGALLADDMFRNPSTSILPVCFFDTDPEKIGRLTAGLPVYAEREARSRIQDLQVQEVIIALPGLTSSQQNALCEMYASFGCVVKIYGTTTPGGMVRRLTEKDYTTLLGRAPLAADNPEMRAFYRDKVVLVTGGGGSIGGELCRQIALCHPKQLIIFDIYENNAYEIQMELTRTYGNALPLAVEIGSVRDPDRLDAVFSHYRPDVVFHAAAHKHVPLMEHSNCEAIKNNVMGTYHTANMAEKYGVQRFVLISTDKAVNPTNVMGASKRMCEMVVQCRHDSATVFAAVRFGNVLGSHGSVIPLMQDQIAAGGPVTVTDREIVRFFMTIPEASQLVMQAGAMARPGELFVLDMGSPVKIWSLAESLIWMSGYIPGKEIKMVEIGLRPGEKKYEELLYKKDDANLRVTKHDHIFIAKEDAPTRAEVEQKLELLRVAIDRAKKEIQSTAIRDAMKAVVPTFHEAEEVNKNADKAKEMATAIDLKLTPAAMGADVTHTASP